MKVRVKDYEKEPHHLMVAMAMAGISSDYMTADLLNDTIKAMGKGDFTIEDGVKLQHEHQKKWDKYFDELKKERDKDED